MLPQEVELTIGALTVAMEAQGEAYQGKLGVAYVILNRALKLRQEISWVVLSPYQFSAWNTEAPTRISIEGIDSTVYAECVTAMQSAYSHHEPDPTEGAISYLNEAEVINEQGKLPSWVSRMTKTVQIGKHTFYK